MQFLCRNLGLVLLLLGVIVSLSSASFASSSSEKVGLMSNRKPLKTAQPQRPLLNDRIRYSPDKVNNSENGVAEYDAIVIGSGIGGLTTASLLGKRGKKVLVLEQHYVAGGCCHTFQRKGYEFATGIHYVGGVDEKKGRPLTLQALLAAVSPIDDPIQLDRMDECYDTIYLGHNEKYEIVAGEKELKEMLLKRFPNEKDAIDKYYGMVQKAEKTFFRGMMLKYLPLPVTKLLSRSGLYQVLMGKRFSKWTQNSCQSQLEELTKNKDLQALWAYNYANYGTEPDRAPLLFQLYNAAHFLDGGFYPRGGPSSIPQKVIQAVTDRGGKVLVSAPVKRIVVDPKTGAATGVEMKHDGKIIKAKVVISDAGFLNTATKLLPKGLLNMDFAKGKEQECSNDAQLHPATSGINLFVGLKGNATDLNLPKGNVWIHSSNDLSATAKRIQGLSLEEALELEDTDCFPVTFIGVPSTKDTSWDKKHPGKSTLEIICATPYHWFEKFVDLDKKGKSRGPEYEAAKLKLAHKMWERVIRTLGTEVLLPKTLDEVDHFEIGTPLTFSHYYQSQRGAWYGLDHDLNRLEPRVFWERLRPEVPEVPNLYLTGQDVAGVSLMGGMVGGVTCAAKILGVVNPLALLVPEKEEQRWDPCYHLCYQ
jgi:all-trans-retinol 13,14-reductase